MIICLLTKYLINLVMEKIEKAPTMILMETITEMTRILREEEKKQPGYGYWMLENQVKGNFPEELIGALKSCLDNPEATFKFNVHYHKSGEGSFKFENLT